MSLLVGDLIEAARDLHPAFTRDRSPDPVLLRALSREQRRLVGQVTAVNPLSLAVWTSVVLLSAYDFDAGTDIPAHVRVHDGEVTFQDGSVAEIRHFSGLDRHNITRRLTFWMEGVTAFLVGSANDWSDSVSMRFQYTPIPAALVARSTALVLPDSAESVCVAIAAEVLAMRAPADARVPVAAFQMARKEAEGAWLSEMATRDVTSWSVTLV